MAEKKRRTPVHTLSVDEFMRCGLNSDEEDTDAEINENDDEEEDSDEQMADAAGEDIVPSVSKHKKSLEKLKEQDPEFYQFLQDEDQGLLSFDDSDSDESDSAEDGDEDSASKAEAKMGKEKGTASKKILRQLKEKLDESSEEEESDDEDGSGGRIHQLPDTLEVASDASLDSDESEASELDDAMPAERVQMGAVVTLKMVSQWEKRQKANPSVAVLHEVIMAFKAAVTQAGDESDEVIKYTVEGSTVFNAIVRLCLSSVVPSLNKILQIHPQSELKKPTFPSHNKRWKKVRLDAKSYLADLLKLLQRLSEVAMINVIMRQVHQLVPFYATFPKLSKLMIKRMIILWSTSDETTRVLALLCISKLLRMLQEKFLEPCIKNMYTSYVQNCKFTSATSLPLINFMQRSLVEILSLDVNMAYQHAFLYIRQLAIHLRNAITIKKKENCQAVYNWQYMHSLGLWVRLLCNTHPNEVLGDLIYPLTQTIIGTLKLMPVARYYPLRFHCVRLLNTLSEATNKFIPILPFLLEVFEDTDFNKKHKSIGFKPINFSCILKLSKSQLQEKSFRDGVVDQLYELLVEQFHVHAHTVGFPELAFPAMVQIRAFLKKCKVANYCKQMKQLLEKVEENARFITQRRRSATIKLSDRAALDTWNRQCKEAETPLGKYYKTWRKLRNRELQHEIAGKDRISGVDQLPTINRPKGPKSATAAERMEFSGLFASDSDEESSDDDTRFLLKEERPSNAKKPRMSKDDNGEYSDFDDDEMDQLEGSADDDSSDDDEDKTSPMTGRTDYRKPVPRQREAALSHVADVVQDFTMSDDSD